MLLPGLLALTLTTGCSNDKGPRAGDAQSVDSGLADAVAGLCQARREAERDPPMAKATFERRAQEPARATADALAPSYSILASRITETLAEIEGAAAAVPPSPAFPHELATLIELLREGLARLGIRTAPCQ